MVVDKCARVPAVAAAAALLAVVACLAGPQSTFQVAEAAKAVPSTLFGGWLFLDNLDAPFNGTVAKFLAPNTNYILLSFVDPRTMVLPDNMIQTIKQFPNHIIMISLGGQTMAGNWDWLASEDQARAAASKAASWAQYGVDGIDIDAEDGALSYPWQNMAAFMDELKKQAPDMKISLCVYGNPEGRDFDNSLINNHLNGNGTRYIDWIHVMAYAGYDLDVRYIEDYTKAPRSPWDHPIDAAVPTDSVIIGMKGAKGFPSCDPQDYASMVGYVGNTGLRGVGIWAFANVNTNVTLPWFDPSCTAGYGTLCRGLIDIPTCGSNITQAKTMKAVLHD